MDPTKIPTETNLTFDQAKREYRELVALQRAAPKFGFVLGIATTINNRMDYLRKLITDKVCEA